MRKRARWFGLIGCTLLIFTVATGPLTAQDVAIISQEDIFHPVVAKNGMVATQEYHATRAGLEVLKEGGNAVDAAVTVAFTLAVTLPRAGNYRGRRFHGDPFGEDRRDHCAGLQGKGTHEGHERYVSG